MSSCSRIVEEVTLSDIRPGFPYSVWCLFEPGLLLEGQTLRADLKSTPTSATKLATFAVERNDDDVALSLTAEQTKKLTLGNRVVDLVLVDDDDTEHAITSPRLLLKVSRHATAPAS